MNGHQALQLRGELSVPSNFGGNATWQVDDSSVDLASIALFPLTVFIAASPAASPSAFTSAVSYMALAGNTLPVGATLTFSLRGVIPYQGQRALGSVTVTVNAPPSSGSFYVSPSEGVELTQVFQFVALQWVDPDLPVSYEFGYTSASGVPVVLRSRLELSFGSSLLPAGVAESAYQVACGVQVFDTLNANSSSTFATKVTKSDFNSSQVDAFVRRQIIDAAADADSVRQATALSSYLLNIVNCTLSPNCSALHRQNCLSTAHTCGSCVSDAYIGEVGDSNEACVSVADFSASRRLLSASNAPKSCPGACSGHGTCVHVVKDSGALITADMPSCLEGALDCLAVCDCDDDFYGSDSCDTATAAFQQSQANRDRVIGGIQSLVGLEDPDQQVVAGWASSLSLASQVSSELTSSSRLTVLSLVDTITGAAGGVSVSSETAQGLLSAVSAVAEASVKANRRRRVRQMRRGLADSSGDGARDVEASDVQSVLNNFGSLLAQSMLPGQGASQFTQGEFRMSAQVLSAASATDSTTAVSVPQTALEKALGHPVSQASVPAADGVSLVVTSLRSQLFEDKVEKAQSNALMLYSPTDVCATASCKVEIVLENSQAVGFDALNSAYANQTFNATCLNADFSEHTFVCHNGESVTLKCDGTGAKVIAQQCPVIRYSSACSSLGGGLGGCTVSSFTDTSTTCECDMYYDRASSRRLHSGGANVTEPAGYSVSYMSILHSTMNTFVSTVLTADNLNASTVVKGWRALATLGALAMGIMVGLFWSNHADHAVKKIAPSSEEKPQTSPSSFSLGRKTIKTDKKKGEKRMRFGARAKKVVVNTELAIVEESLPRALSSRTFSDRFLEEVKQHHRWFGIVFYFSDSFPRVLRVISLASNAIIMLFIQSITYNLTNPDDGSCAALHTETDCLVPKSPFATGESKCAWSASTSDCTYIEPDNSMRIILFVAIFCAIVTTPIALAVDWVVRNVLSAPTQETVAEVVTTEVMTSLVPGESSRRITRQKSATFSSFMRVFTNEEKVAEDKILIAASRAELTQLSAKLIAYRSKLRADELQEFNSKLCCPQIFVYISYFILIIEQCSGAWTLKGTS